MQLASCTSYKNDIQSKNNNNFYRKGEATMHFDSLFLFILFVLTISQAYQPGEAYFFNPRKNDFLFK